MKRTAAVLSLLLLTSCSAETTVQLPQTNIAEVTSVAETVPAETDFSTAAAYEAEAAENTQTQISHVPAESTQTQISFVPPENAADAAILDLENVMGEDLSFLSDCTQLKRLYISGFDGDMTELCETLSYIDGLEVLTLSDVHFSDERANQLILSERNTLVRYEHVSGYGDDTVPEGVGAALDYPVIYNGDSLFGLWLYNNTDNQITVNNISMERYYDGRWQSEPFKDGSTSVEADIVIEPYKNIADGMLDCWIYRNPFDIALVEDMFCYDTAPAGRYRLVFETDSGSFERDFMVKGANELSALTDEQRAVFEAAVQAEEKYFDTSGELTAEQAAEYKSADEFIEKNCGCFTRNLAMRKLSYHNYLDPVGNLQEALWGGGSNIMHAGSVYEVIESTDREVIIRENAAIWHGDFPQNLYYTMQTVKLVNTDSGWKADIFTTDLM